MIYEVAKETVVMSGFVLIMLMDVWAVGKGLLWLLRKLWQAVTKKKDTP